MFVHHIDAGSQPVLYSRFKYLFASGTFVMARLAASYFKSRLVLRAAAYKLIASVMYSASGKFPGYCLPVLTASTNNGSACAPCCTWFLLSVAELGLSIFTPEMI